MKTPRAEKYPQTLETPSSPGLRPDSSLRTRNPEISLSISTEQFPGTLKTWATFYEGSQNADRAQKKQNISSCSPKYKPIANEINLKNQTVKAIEFLLSPNVASTPRVPRPQI